MVTADLRDDSDIENVGSWPYEAICEVIVPHLNNFNLAESME